MLGQSFTIETSWLRENIKKITKPLYTSVVYYSTILNNKCYLR